MKKDIGTKKTLPFAVTGLSYTKNLNLRKVQVFTGYKLKNVVNSWFKNIIYQCSGQTMQFIVVSELSGHIP